MQKSKLIINTILAATNVKASKSGDLDFLNSQRVKVKLTVLNALFGDLSESELKDICAQAKQFGWVVFVSDGYLCFMPEHVTQKWHRLSPAMLQHCDLDMASEQYWDNRGNHATI